MSEGECAAANAAAKPIAPVAPARPADKRWLVDLLLLGMLWGASFLFMRIGAAEFGALPTAAVRAVGAAVGRNPISVIVPCHRVLGTDGSLTGYAGGLERKSALLELEGAL